MARTTSPNAEIIPISVAKSIDPIPSTVIDKQLCCEEIHPRRTGMIYNIIATGMPSINVIIDRYNLLEMNAIREGTLNGVNFFVINARIMTPGRQKNGRETARNQQSEVRSRRSALFL
jgi:hypothetical protein